MKSFRVTQMRRVRVTRHVQANSPIEALVKFSKLDLKLPPHVEIVGTADSPVRATEIDEKLGTHEVR